MVVPLTTTMSTLPMANAAMPSAQRGAGMSVSAAAAPPHQLRLRPAWRRAGLNRWRYQLPAASIGAASVIVVAAARRRGSRRRRDAYAAAASATGIALTAVKEDDWFEQQCSSIADPFDAGLSERGVALLDQLEAPSKKQEAWKYSDLQALLYDVSEAAAVASPTPEALQAAVAELLEDEQAPSSSSSSSAPADSPPCPRLVFIDGELSQEFSRLSQDVGTLLSTGQAMKAQGDAAWKTTEALLAELPEVNMFPEAGYSRDQMGLAKMAALNQSLFKDCACLRLDESSATESEASQKLEVVFISTGAAGAAVASPRLIMEVGAGRHVHVVESHLSLDPSDASLSNGVCRVVVATGAKVKHELLQQKADGSRFVETVIAEVEEGGEYDVRVVQTGARAARVNVAILLAGRSSACDVTGVHVLDGNQQIDLHSFIHHVTPGCKSRQMQKNIVASTAECIFKGKIQVDKLAQQTNSEQLCRTLLISKKARIKAMPLLQIKADDVVCSHGAAVTELDKDQVFYLSSRGLSPQESKKMMLQAFPQDLLGGLAETAPKAHQRVLDKLALVADSVE